MPKSKWVIIWIVAVLMLSACNSQAEELVLSVPETTQMLIQSATEPTQEIVVLEEQPPETNVSETQLPTEPLLVLHSGLKEDGTFGEGTLFLGDSLTYMLVGSYLQVHDLIGEANYAAMCGSKVTAFFDDDFRMGCHKSLASGYSEEFYGMTFQEVVDEMGEQATAVYMMWGTNYEPNATAQTYIELADYILSTCPNATIHMQLIPYGNVPYTSVNKLVTETFNYFQDMGEQRILLIDTYTAIGRYPVDGVHQGEGGNRRWYEAIVAHAEANGLVQ